MRSSTGKYLVLESSAGSSNDLIRIKTGAKKETEENLKTDIQNWMDNAHFRDFSKKKIDLAIVVYVSHMRYLDQDCDNIAKPVLDALSKSKQMSDETRFLIENDSQVIRLLVYKCPKKDKLGIETDEIVISFREHDPLKQMILVDGNTTDRRNLKAFRRKDSDGCELTGEQKENGAMAYSMTLHNNVHLTDYQEESRND